MATAVPKNAIETRLDVLVGLWNEFAENPEARVLRWLVDQDEASMIDVFIEVQNEEGGDVPDLFIRFDEPFEDPTGHGFSLVQSLQHKYEDIREDIGKEGIAADWACPSLQAGASDVEAFVACCRSLQMHYNSLMVHLVAVFTPERVADYGVWQIWLRKIIHAGLPENVRVMLLDDAMAPALEPLAEAEPVLIISVKPELDMPGAMLELVRRVPGNGPGFTFRRLFVALTNAAAQGDLQAAGQAARSALAIAEKQGWPQMQVVIHMALGAAYLGVKKTAEALVCYRSAGVAGGTTAAQGDPTGPKLILQSKLAEGAALVSEDQHAEAAKVYEEAAGLAEQQQDHLMTMESWRMAAYCHEVSKQIESSWGCGQAALDAAEQLDAETRSASTLPFVGQGLLRLVPEQNPEMAHTIRERMQQLVGPEWETSLP